MSGRHARILPLCCFGRKKKLITVETADILGKRGARLMLLIFSAFSAAFLCDLRGQKLFGS
jgi:hypothetical protein